MEAQTSSSLPQLSMAQLVAERERLNEQIALVRKNEQAEALRQVRALMSEHGLTVADITLSQRHRGGDTTKVRAAVAVKFRHPTSGETWTGRGLQPRWMKAFLAEGGSLEQARVS